MSKPAQVSKPKRGPSRKAGSYRDVQERTGIPESTIRAAEKHVEAVEKYPELEELPQGKAIEVGKRLDSVPEPEREKTVGEILGDEAENAVWDTPWDPPPERKEYYKVIKWVVRMDQLDMEKVFACCKNEYEVERDLEYARKWREAGERAEKALEKRQAELRPGNLRAVPGGLQ